MANFVEIKLYGSETESSTEYPLKSAVEAYSDIVANADLIVTYDVERVGAKPIVKFDDKIFLNNKKLVTTKVRIGYNPLSEKQQYPESAQTFESYFSTDFINATFHYIWLNDYNIRPDYSGSPLPDTRVMKCNITNWELIEDDPHKQFAIEVEGTEVLS